jgi:hypothetical protein
MVKRKTEIVGINYWKRIREEKDGVIGNLHGLVFLIHNSAEFPQIINFLNQVKPNKKLVVLYFSLINSYSNISSILKKKPTPNKEFHVIDCVSMFLGDLEDTTHCIYLKPPQNLKELKQIILDNIQRVNPNIFMVDSLSQFINFTLPSPEELRDFYFFLKDIRESVSGLTDDAVILLYDDTFGSLRSLPVMNVDLILKFELIRDEVRWKG